MNASGEYRMGDHDSRADAIRLALEAAKKDALEQVATYIERITDVRDLNVTRDDIRSYTAGIVKVVDQTVTTRLEQDQVIMRVDLTAEIDPHDVVQAITALRENDQARQELMALRAETDRLQEQVDATNRAWPQRPRRATSSSTRISDRDMLDQLQANAMLTGLDQLDVSDTGSLLPSLVRRPRHQRAVAARAPSLSAASPPSTRATDDHRLQPPVPPTLSPTSVPQASHPSLLMPPVPSIHSSGSTA